MTLKKDSGQTSWPTQQLKVKVHPEKQAGWCQGWRPRERAHKGRGGERTQLGTRWALLYPGSSFTKEMSAKGNPLQQPQEIREKNSPHARRAISNWQWHCGKIFDWGTFQQKCIRGMNLFQTLKSHWQTWKQETQLCQLGGHQSSSW